MQKVKVQKVKMQGVKVIPMKLSNKSSDSTDSVMMLRLKSWPVKMAFELTEMIGDSVDHDLACIDAPHKERAQEKREGG